MKRLFLISLLVAGMGIIPCMAQVAPDPEPDPNAPQFTVTPETITPQKVNIGDSALVAEFTITQKNLVTPVSLYLTGKNRGMWYLESEETDPNLPEAKVKLWYKPTQTGKHTAALNIESSKTNAYNMVYHLAGTCIDPANPPQITITPTSLPQFVAKVGTEVKDTISVSSKNCIDYVNVKITPAGAGFYLNTTQLLKNFDAKTIITFRPLKEGTYTATVTWETEEGTPQSVKVSGVATASDPAVQDWVTVFNWDMSNPKALLNEHFDNIEHNKTLQLSGWQNVVRQGARPWWGFEDKNNDGEHCAKATAYIGGEETSTMYEMWLITPALDYKNAENQVFTFRVRGDYLTDDMSAKLQLYFIDATDTADIFYQDLEVKMPATKDESGDWLDFQVNLTGQENIPDVFFMGFKFTGESGQTGSATYLIDDVSWGRNDLPLISVDSPEFYETVKPDELKTFVLKVTGANLTESITMSFTGNHPSKFKMSPNTLPAEGGLVALGFQSDVEGIQDAYLRLRSRGAVDAYVHITVWVKQETALDNVGSDEIQPHFLLENGVLYILTPQGKYTILGTKWE